MTRKWPHHIEPADFEFDILNPVVKWIIDYYELHSNEIHDPRNHKDIPEWDGLPLGFHDRAVAVEPNDCLAREGLEWSYDDQGRTPLEAIISIAIQLGIEQGRRLHAGKLLESIDWAKKSLSVSCAELDKDGSDDVKKILSIAHSWLEHADKLNRQISFINGEYNGGNS